MYAYLGENVAKGYKTGKTLMKVKKVIYIEDCMKQHGLQTDEVWYKAFAGLDVDTENYIRNMLANDEKLTQNPSITLSTIHAAKGGEADNVLFFLILLSLLLTTMILIQMNYTVYFM